MKRLNFVLAIVGGFVGGALVSYIHPVTASAQSGAMQEIKAQCFTLVNKDGVALGSFSFDGSGRSQLVIRDQSGHEVWKLVGDHVERRSNYSRFDTK